jgi:site-specific DNA-methyltransferase (adenine-specific)
MNLHHGDCFEVMQGLPDNSVDLVLTDPPYGLAFMGKKWDYDVPRVEIWAEALRVLKPGGHLLAFAGTRTQHRMACRIEDAGFEIRDMLAWVYGSGFPKSHNGPWGGTALKPALEPITMARKPLVGTVAANVLEYGTGGLNIDACRVGTDGGGTQCNNRDVSGKCMGHKNAGRSTSGETFHGPNTNTGRWPANLIHDGSDDTTAPMRSAARFFYCAKASKRERNEANTHPTVKPIALMEYLCKLASAPGAVVLDPFMGSGTTGIACRNLGREFIGIERDADYFEIAKNRIEHTPKQMEIPA